MPARLRLAVLLAAALGVGAVLAIVLVDPSHETVRRPTRSVPEAVASAAVGRALTGPGPDRLGFPADVELTRVDCRRAGNAWACTAAFSNRVRVQCTVADPVAGATAPRPFCPE